MNKNSKVSSFFRQVILLPGILIIPIVMFGQNLTFDQYQQSYSDSLYKNPQYSRQVCDTVLAQLKRAPESSEVTEQKAFWFKQKGTTQYVQKKYTNAIEYYRSSFKHYQTLKDTLGMSKTLSNMGICFEEQNVDDEALKNYNKALELLKTTDYPFRYTVLSNILSLLLKKELYNRVKNESLNALKEDLPTDQTRISFLSNLGAAYSGLEKYDSALYYTNQAYTLASQKGYRINEVQLLINLANQHQKNNSLNEAKRHLLTAETLSKKYLYSSFDKNIFQGLGIIYFKLQNYSRSTEYFTKALDLARNENDLYLVADLLQNLSMSKAMVRDYKSAYSTLKEYSNLRDSLQGIESKKVVAELSAKYQSLEQQNEILKLNNEKEFLKVDTKLKASTIENQNIKLANRNRFIIGLVIILSISIVSFYLFYSRRKVVAEKAALELKNQQLELERKLLQSQMNPHFIFNALNSIQRFVSESDAFNAQVYLGRFGKLMRNILEQSRKEQITLEEELETLQLYIELETLRFNNKFSATISSDFEDNSEIKIPPMIIQPFVENAILHGFKGVESDGKLNIHFKKVNETEIVCIIEDNGIGRKKANENVKGSTLKKTSLGTEVTRDRLNAMNKDNGESIVYEDLPQGTRVKVYLYT